MLIAKWYVSSSNCLQLWILDSNNLDSLLFSLGGLESGYKVLDGTAFIGGQLGATRVVDLE